MMKTKKITLSISTFFLLLFCVTMQSQTYSNTKNERTSIFRTQLKEAFNSMTKNATLAKRVEGKSCSSEDLISKFKTNDESLFILTWAYSPFVSGAGLFLQEYTAEDFDKGNFKTLEDKALHAYSTTSSFGEFVYALTGKEAFEIKEAITSGDGKKHKDIDYLDYTYKSIKEFLNNEIQIYNSREASNGCVLRTNYTMKVKNYSYPNIEYQLKAEVNVTCDCELEDKTETSVKSGYFEYEATTSGLFTHTSFTFSKAKNPKANVISLECCPKKEKEEPTETALADDGIEDLMPDQFIGGGVGFGATQDFKDISYCLSAEYLKRIGYGSDTGLYLGVEGSYSNSSFNNSSSNRLKIGPKLQYHIPATPSEQTQYVVGVMGNYVLGTNENGAFKDDVTGIVACAYGGVNIRVCENWSVFGQFPVLIYETFTFKPESGGEFKTDGTSLLLNKENPLKLGVRFNF